MAVSGISSYNNAMYQWQSQQLKSTGNSSSNSATSTALNTLFGGSASMTSQISSMVELTKYAMNAMGLSENSRVTFSQITRYREQLQSEFNEGVKKGLAESGIANVNALSFELDKNGKITAISDNAQDRKAAQAWLDANPDYGQTLLKSLPKDAFEENSVIAFDISSTGHISVQNKSEKAIQNALNEKASLAEKTRQGLKEAGIEIKYPLDLKFDENGNLVTENQVNAAEINAWLAENSDLANAVKNEMKNNGVEATQVTLRLDAKNAPQVSVNNASINEIQAAFDKDKETGAKIINGLSNLGIDKNISFAIQINDDGTISVISDHPDAAKMQQFFNDNPELVKKYQQIEALAGIDDARKAMQISPSSMRKRIQIESMTSWWASSGNANSYFGNYNANGLALMSGFNLKA